MLPPGCDVLAVAHLSIDGQNPPTSTTGTAMRNRLATLLLLSLGAGSAVIAAEPLSPESMWALERLSPPAIAPDGRHAVAAVTRYDIKEDKGISDLWLFATDGTGARILTTDSSNESNPVFSPDGRWLAFVAQRGEDKAPQLYVLPMAGGEARRITSVPTGVVAPKWYGDSRRLAFVSRVWPDLEFPAMAERLKERSESKMTARVWEGAPLMYWDQWIDERQAHLYRVSVDGDTPQALTTRSGLELPRSLADATSYDIDPVDGQIAFVADSDPADNLVDLDVFLLDEASGQARNLSAGNEGSDNVPQWSPDGRLLAFARQTIRGFYGDTRRLVVYDRKGKTQLVMPHPHWDRSADGLVWWPDSRGLYGAIDDASTVRVWELPLRGKPRPLTGPGNVGALAISGGRDPVLVGLRESFVEPPTLVRIDRRKGSTTRLDSLNVERLATFALGHYESVKYAGANDAPIQMWINYPPGFDAGKRWPVILLLHGGPHNGVTDAWSWRWNAQLFAAKGYVVAWHNFHGSSGFGQEFADAINPRQDALPYEDTLKAAQWLAAQPWTDGERMVAAGGSYGGYLASILLGRAHPFKALVAHAAVYNGYTQIGSDFGFAKSRFPEFWEEGSVLAQTSPHLGAANFRTPTLVIHGQLDYRVPVNHGIELYQTLKKLGVPSKLIYYPNENHWVLKPQNSIFWYREVLEWIGRYAKPGAE
ncbi:MAG: Dipeptidyl-peptidase 5 [Xanthomonadales bacterium]|nr:Dipeptidyl-peptidase 5 [Xanthomonadales bacterium]